MVMAVVGFAALSGVANGQQSVNSKPTKLVAFGDSLTAGLGLPQAASFPAKLEAALLAKGHKVEVVNAGVSGDTVADGLARLDWSIPRDADAVIIELGANDALRGLDPKATRAGLDEIVKRLRQRNVAVMLAGMYAPRNLGPDYSAQFDPIYPDLAKAYDLPLYPFFLDGVATDPKLNQADGLHPTAAGVDVIVARILPTVEALLTKVSAQRS
ncbi:MAG: arylesterase [Pseudolabrys sp.]|nr:arylesterase [Pseudolabrys sp.]